MRSVLQHALIAVLFCTSTALAGGQGALGDHPQNSGTPQTGPIMVQSTGMIFLVPKSRNKLMAFSTMTGNWSHTDIAIGPGSLKELKIYPTVGISLAACKLGSELHAYSAKTDQWAKLRIPQDANYEAKVNYSVGNNIITAYIRTETTTKLYVFSETSEAWSGVDSTTGELLSGKENE